MPTHSVQDVRSSCQTSSVLCMYVDYMPMGNHVIVHTIFHEEAEVIRRPGQLQDESSTSDLGLEVIVEILQIGIQLCHSGILCRLHNEWYMPLTEL